MKTYKLYKAGEKYLIITGQRRTIGQVVYLNGKYHARIRTSEGGVMGSGHSPEAAFDAVVNQRLYKVA